MDNNYDIFLQELFDSEVEIKRKPRDNVEFNEVVELFVHSIVLDIMLEEEQTPRFNIIFSDECLEWLRELLKNPFKKDGYWIPNMTDVDIKRLERENQCFSGCPTVIVKDYKLFFKLLTDICNEQVGLYYDYGSDISARAVSLVILRKIWLRMGPDDFFDVELFLSKQLQFIKNREFDNPDEEIYLKNYNGYKITYEVEMCEMWCESTRRIEFKIYDGMEYHSLPKVYYDICSENGELVCYISAVQNGYDRKRIKYIERELYKLNSGIDDSKVHPNKVMALKLFYEMLSLYNINHIKVPIVQVLSHRYHEILSMEVKEEFEKKWNSKKLERMDRLKDSTDVYDKKEYERLCRKYENDKINYNRFVDREDFISMNKIEGLINLFIHMSYIDRKMCINTEPFISGSYLDIILDSSRINKR